MKEHQVGEMVLVSDHPLPVKIHGKVGVGYFYIANLDGELWPLPVKANIITPFLDI